MKKIYEYIQIVEELEEKYELSTESIEQIKEHYEDFKVYVPLIGRFSAGKSALINNLLGWGTEVCRENIGVATAIPTEIMAGDEDVACICCSEKKYVSMQEYMDMRDSISADNADVVKLILSENEVLEKFPNVALVDMPGLDSGYEVHDRAIEQYLKKSMSYVLVFPADELTIPKSMEAILEELNSYDMPMCVVITKGNRIAGVEEQRKYELKQSLSKYFKNKDIRIFVTEKENGRVEEFVEYLANLEKQANQLGKEYYTKKMKPELAQITNFLSGVLKNMELSGSELEEKQESLVKDIDNLNSTVDKELSEFENQVPKLIDGIAMDVQAALSNKMEEFVSDLIHDTDVTNDINSTVRTALSSSYQSRVMENIKKHLNKILGMMSVGVANYASGLRIDIDKVCGKEITGIGRTAIDAIALIVAGPLGGILAHFITGIINKNSAEKRNEAKMKVREQLSNNVFPAIDKDIRDKVGIDLKHIALEVRQTVEKDVLVQVEALRKSLDEVNRMKNEEDEFRASKKIQIESDLNQLLEIGCCMVE